MKSRVTLLDLNPGSTSDPLCNLRQIIQPLCSSIHIRVMGLSESNRLIFEKHYSTLIMYQVYSVS